jgi:acetate kinase
MDCGGYPGRVTATDRPTQVLVVNCGSSSVKFERFATSDWRSLERGAVERIGADVPDHASALAAVLRSLDAGGLRDADLAVIGHRVVHGGDRFPAPVRIDAGVRAAIRELGALAPLHNPIGLLGIEAFVARFPAVPQVAVFDTAFHATLPPRAHRYAVPEAWRERFGVRRWGFHGISHRFVAERTALALGRALGVCNLITLHLGNGASATAIRAGRSVDTSMGMTPLGGLVMGTRSGDLDPAIPLHVQRVGALDADAVEAALNQDSGLRGLCGSDDLREVLARAAAGDARADLALDVYCDAIRKLLGAYTAVLGRVDAVAFAGGVGENAAEVRRRTCADLERLGIALDEGANAAASGDVVEIGRARAAVRVFVVRTDEELAIAREAWSVTRGAA